MYVFTRLSPNQDQGAMGRRFEGILAQGVSSGS
jgi:hypothetical protein